MKVNLSSFMNSSIFESLDGVYKDKTELSKLQNSVKIGDISEIKTNQSGIKNTYFITKVNGVESTLGVNLSNDTLQKLKDFFGDDVMLDEKGNAFLSEKANQYVSGWFNDIAFRRGHLAADKENKGYVDESGVKDLYIDARSSMRFGSDGMYYVSDFSTYNKTDSFLIATGAYKNFKISIDDALEHSINSDIDFDGKISVKENELYYDKENISTITENTLIVGANDLRTSLGSFSTFDVKSDVVDRQKRELELLEAIAALSNIISKINKDGIESLSNDDKDKLDLLNITPDSLKSPQKLINASDKALKFVADSIGAEDNFLKNAKSVFGYASDKLKAFSELKSSFLNDLKSQNLLDIKA